jgi:hypothetical protein
MAIRRRWITQARHAGRIALCMALGGAGPLAAQGLAPQRPDGGRSWVVGFSHYAKWGALAGAVAFTALAVDSHNQADRYFSGLKQFCEHASTECQVGPDGTYRSADAERLWQATAASDRQARWWLVGGQASLVVAGGMFLLDMVSGNSTPKNIPFTPFQVYAEPRKLGLQLQF